MRFQVEPSFCLTGGEEKLWNRSYKTAFPAWKQRGQLFVSLSNWLLLRGCPPWWGAGKVTTFCPCCLPVVESYAQRRWLLRAITVNSECAVRCARHGATAAFATAHFSPSHRDEHTKLVLTSGALHLLFELENPSLNRGTLASSGP